MKNVLETISEALKIEVEMREIKEILHRYN